MNIQKVVKELKAMYPNRVIFKNDEENPSEIICEIDPSSEHPDYSVAIAVIDNTVTHVHRLSTEIYEVIRGILTIDISGKTSTLSQGQKITIKPGEYHRAMGQETWIKVTSRPGWTSEDHILIEK